MSDICLIRPQIIHNNLGVILSSCQFKRNVTSYEMTFLMIRVLLCFCSLDRVEICINLSLAAQSVDEGCVWEEAIFILRVGQFGEEGDGVFFGDLIGYKLNGIIIVIYYLHFYFIDYRWYHYIQEKI